MEIQNLKAILNEDQELVTIAALLNEELHYTADIRTGGYDCYAVFSRSTKFNEKLHNPTDELLESGVYTQHDINYKRGADESGYFYLELDLGDLNYKK